MAKLKQSAIVVKKSAPAKTTVKATKVAVQPKPKMIAKSTPNKMDSFRKKADSLSESGFKKSINKNFVGMDKDFKEAKKIQGNAYSELEKYKSKVTPKKK